MLALCHGERKREALKSNQRHDCVHRVHEEFCRWFDFARFARYAHHDTAAKLTVTQG
jgi:hypothetical protein